MLRYHRRSIADSDPIRTIATHNVGASSGTSRPFLRRERYFDAGRTASMQGAPLPCRAHRFHAGRTVEVNPSWVSLDCDACLGIPRDLEFRVGRRVRRVSKKIPRGWPGQGGQRVGGFACPVTSFR